MANGHDIYENYGLGPRAESRAPNLYFTRVPNDKTLRSLCDIAIPGPLALVCKVSSIVLLLRICCS